MLKSFAVSSAILLGITIIESSIFTNLPFLLVVPDFILICNIYFGLLNGKLYGETSGFVSGLFIDFISGTPIGFNSIFRIIIGYIAGIFSDYAILKSIVMPVLSVSIGTLVKRLLILLLAFLFPRTSLHPYGFISYEFLFEFLANILLAPFVFKFLSCFNNSLSIKDTKDMIDNV
ncbi:MAG: rod shape-determining protein MreD [Treponema sp.]|nr:rod shape-determining protein MreD [Treponema sp.]